MVEKQTPKLGERRWGPRVLSAARPTVCEAWLVVGLLGSSSVLSACGGPPAAGRSESEGASVDAGADGDAEDGGNANTDSADDGLDSIGDSFDDGAGDGDEADGNDGDGGDSGDGGDDGDDGGVSRFDLGGLPDWEIPDGEDKCDDFKHVPCDDSSNDPLHAIGVNCPGEAPVVEGKITGVEGAVEEAHELRQSFGTAGAFNPTEGARYLVLGTGHVADLDNETPPGDDDEQPTQCNDALGEFPSNMMLPAPINPMRVGAVDCIADPSLIGTGDCSNTIQAQWDAAQVGPGMSRMNDYIELRLNLKVPEFIKGLSFDFSFLTTEYPEYYPSQFNDMFIVWLEASNWTGNISFDREGNPISLNAGFMDFKDVPGGVPEDPDCNQGCVAPELAGTCMKQHAGTQWLTTKMPVIPGDEITLIFAIFDMSDPILDSYVFIDNLRWECEAPDGPSTDPPSR